jgi:CcmD family protein
MQFLEYVAAAYSIIWAAILLYFLNMSKREREIWTELQELRDSISHEDAKKPSEG